MGLGHIRYTQDRAEDESGRENGWSIHQTGQCECKQRRTRRLLTGS
jgi:hypothetical protein